MVSAHLYRVSDKDFGSSKATAKQEKWENMLQAIITY